MAVDSVGLIKAFLKDRKNLQVVQALCTPDVTYVSLNYSNPDLKKSMPWCGTGTGVEAIVSTFERVEQYWSVDDFSPEATFGDERFVAVFGRMTLTSTVLHKTVTSPFSIFCKLTGGKISYMQFMETPSQPRPAFVPVGSGSFAAIQRVVRSLRRPTLRRRQNQLRRRS